MQTFLPYADFEESASCLDNRRLGKQRVEVLQILRVLTGKTNGWSNHPAVKMWRGFEVALANYGLFICWEWQGRGYKDTCFCKIHDLFPDGRIAGLTITYPVWLGDDNFHRAHRSNLLRKDETFYRQFGWNEPMDLPYVWPTTGEK